jgi:hypothetical protein
MYVCMYVCMPIMFLPPTTNWVFVIIHIVPKRFPQVGVLNLMLVGMTDHWMQFVKRKNAIQSRETIKGDKKGFDL